MSTGKEPSFPNVNGEQIRFKEMPKMPRLRKPAFVTEKIDGTNASVHVFEDGQVWAASRTRWIVPDDDNFGFALWVSQNEDALREGLGIGSHFGEWWGVGVQRGYGLHERRFSLFNVGRWQSMHQSTMGSDALLVPGTTFAPECCHVVPVLAYHDSFFSGMVDNALRELKKYGSVAAPGFLYPEGVVVYHTAGRFTLKQTFDDKHKGE